MPKMMGILVQVDVSGVGVIEECTSHNKFAFTFDKVKGYFGQSLAECGLMPGNRVNFFANEKRVESLEVVIKSAESLEVGKGLRAGSAGA